MDCSNCAGCGQMVSSRQTGKDTPLVMFTEPITFPHKICPCTKCGGTGVTKESIPVIARAIVSTQKGVDVIWQGRFNGRDAVLKKTENGAYILAWDTGSSWASCTLAAHDPIHRLVIQILEPGTSEAKVQ